MGTTVRDATSFSAMLESSDHGSSSLDSVMTSSTSSCTGTPGDSHQFFASQHNSPLQESSYLPSFAASRQQLATPTSSGAQMPEWPYARDETWVFEPSRRTPGTRTADLRSNIGVSESYLDPPEDGRRSLQRGSSAPSRLYEECLADFNFAEVDRPRSSDPYGDIDDDLLSWADSLAPIVERGPQQMETEIPASDESSSVHGCSEQFFVCQTGFERQISTISTSTQSFGQEVVEPRSLMHQESLGAYGAIPAIEENMEESTTSPSFNQIGSFMSQAESMIGTSEETYGGANSTMSSAYSAPDYQASYHLGNELQTGAASGNGLWNSPGASGMLEGNKLLCGIGEIGNNEPAGWLGSTSAAGLNVGGTVEQAPLLPDLDLVPQSSLPSNPRAHRGHATHPRSVAERVRRGKISERMKKLQDLVPNMERQNNTADMLDEVVGYVKQLKLQVKELSQTVVQLKEMSLHPN
ncbi:hypothetical protein KC19_4G208300 [Ceratodon purpureus]|uniref:BHLH domain-containing protein n=1 Tax=Ceratodon purpureus TaxID=3225 RepID=A0A8T0IEH4_CERPU|nr:hypothetical protein KC19_4G208300 [Ceratodon purpureus]